MSSSSESGDETATYRCENCGEEFETGAALGGHASYCDVRSYRVIASRASTWHRPSRRSTPESPEPACRTVLEERDTWGTMDPETADVWRSECSYCSDTEIDRTCSERWPPGPEATGSEAFEEPGDDDDGDDDESVEFGTARPFEEIAPDGGRE